MNSVFATHYWSIDDIKRANKNAGQYFFSPDTMRFFKSRVSEEVHQGPGGVYFVTSERGPIGDSPRLFTVRSFDPTTGRCDTVRDFQKFKTSKSAHKLAAELAKGGK